MSDIYKKEIKLRGEKESRNPAIQPHGNLQQNPDTIGNRQETQRSFSTLVNVAQTFSAAENLVNFMNSGRGR